MPSSRDGGAEQHRRGRGVPIERAHQSLTMPPSARAKMFIMPKVPATNPAVRRLELEVVDEVERGDIVDGQLHAEAGGIDNCRGPRRARSRQASQKAASRRRHPASRAPAKSPSAVSCVRK